ncbi:hypothetical protein K438DRAFT_1759511 [Mycena galopus ATCC 62051]|nr:hypothetical protein K438DRAFT_1759511 [Mycena galopus ATCC 62051]
MDPALREYDEICRQMRHLVYPCIWSLCEDWELYQRLALPGLTANYPLPPGFLLGVERIASSMAWITESDGRYHNYAFEVGFFSNAEGLALWGIFSGYTCLALLEIPTSIYNDPMFVLSPVVVFEGLLESLAFSIPVRIVSVLENVIKPEGLKSARTLTYRTPDLRIISSPPSPSPIHLGSVSFSEHSAQLRRYIPVHVMTKSEWEVAGKGESGGMGWSDYFAITSILALPCTVRIVATRTRTSIWGTTEMNDGVRYKDPQLMVSLFMDSNVDGQELVQPNRERCDTSTDLLRIKKVKAVIEQQTRKIPVPNCTRGEVPIGWLWASSAGRLPKFNSAWWSSGKVYEEHTVTNALTIKNLLTSSGRSALTN